MHALVVASSLQNPVLVPLKKLLRSREGFHEPVLAGLERAEEQCLNLSPQVVIVVLGQDNTGRIFDLLQRLRKHEAGHLLAIGPGTDPKLILRALQAGADHFVDQDELETELVAALVKLRGKHEAAKGTRRLLAVLSASGGCGASTVAVNLATVLAKEHDRCHLIDLHTGQADLAALLDLVPQYTISDLCRNEARLDNAMYEKLLEQHSSGIRLLAAPRDFCDAAFITSRGVEQALTLAQDLFTNVVVDLEDCFHEEQVIALQHASEIVLVSRLDFLAIRNSRRILDHLRTLNIPPQRIKLVINHYGHPDDLPLAEAEEALGIPPAVLIPHDPHVICGANNSGVPAAFKHPNSTAVNAIASIVGLERKPVPNGLLPRLRSYLRAHLVAWSMTSALALSAEGRS